MPAARKKKSAKVIENTSSVAKAFRELRELIVRGYLPPRAWTCEQSICRETLDTMARVTPRRPQGRTGPEEDVR